MNRRPTTVEDIAREMFLSNQRFEFTVRQWEAEILGIFGQAEQKIFNQRSRILAAMRSSGGNLDGSPEALARIQTMAEQIRNGIETDMVKPARDWADEVIPASWGRGKDLARANLAFGQIDRDTVREAFLNIRPAEAGILETGIRDTYRIMGTVGDDVAEFMRSTMTEAAILGIPIQGRGDTLENRLFESGRLKPIQIKTKDGRIITRSLRQRSIAIARIETAKVYNRVHELKTKEVFGDDAVYVNANPEDSRTTEICANASKEEPKTLAEWDASPFGRPPRLKPDFHLCRSFLLGGTPKIFRDAGHPKAAPGKPGRPPGSKNKTKKVQDQVDDAANAVRPREFVPATSTANAEKYAKAEGLVSGQINYTGLPVETANEVNRAAWDIKNKFGYMPLKDLVVGKGNGNALADALNGSIRMHPKMFDNARVKANAVRSRDSYLEAFANREKQIEGLKADLARGANSLGPLDDRGKKWIQKQIEAMEKDPPARQWTVADGTPADGAYGIIMHEYGHAAHYFGGIVPSSVSGKPARVGLSYGYDRLGGVNARKTTDSFKKTMNAIEGKISAAGRRTAFRISEYAGTNTKEHFAESWVAYHTGFADLLSPEVLEVVKEIAANVKAGAIGTKDFSLTGK